jgi:hypothetical protein
MAPRPSWRGYLRLWNFAVFGRKWDQMAQGGTLVFHRSPSPRASA